MVKYVSKFSKFKLNIHVFVATIKTFHLVELTPFPKKSCI